MSERVCSNCSQFPCQDSWFEDTVNVEWQQNGCVGFYGKGEKPSFYHMCIDKEEITFFATNPKFIDYLATHSKRFEPNPHYKKLFKKLKRTFAKYSNTPNDTPNKQKFEQELQKTCGQLLERSEKLMALIYNWYHLCSPTKGEFHDKWRAFIVR